MRTLTFNYKPFSDFAVFWDGSTLFGTPQKDSSFYSVPGKNGDLEISNNRFLNKEIEVNCFVRSNFIENYNNLIDYLYSQEGYKRFENSLEPDVFRMASFISEIEPDTGRFIQHGQFSLKFNFKPQKWLKQGEIAIDVTSDLTLVNPTSFAALPLIEVEGTGTININDSMLTLANNTSVSFIDCELQDCYEGAINRNPDLTVTNGFPKLGKISTVMASGFTSVKIYPRWWRI